MPRSLSALSSCEVVIVLGLAPIPSDFARFRRVLLVAADRCCAACVSSGLSLIVHDDGAASAGAVRSGFGSHSLEETCSPRSSDELQQPIDGARLRVGLGELETPMRWRVGEFRKIAERNNT